MEITVKLKETFSGWLDGLASVFGSKGREASEEISAMARPGSRDDAEQALWQAMGWSEPEGEDALKVVDRVAGEALE